jgi:hypothetical protein
MVGCVLCYRIKVDFLMPSLVIVEVLIRLSKVRLAYLLTTVLILFDASCTSEDF